MPLPEGFSEWENLQDLVRHEHNKAVRAYFKNQADDDISTPKARLKHSCLIKDSDTATMTQLRLWLFEVTCGHAASLQTPIYGVPVQELQRQAKFKPQVKLYFKERIDSTVTDDRYLCATGEITFRLMNETSETINRTKAETLARNIKNVFATPVFVWEKGWYKATYLDLERGYDLRLLVRSKSEGQRIIRQVLQIQNHTYDDNNFQFIDHERTYPLNPGTHRVYGRNIKKIIERPRVDLRFRHAQLLIWGQRKAVNLVALAGARLQSVIERVQSA